MSVLRSAAAGAACGALLVLIGLALMPAPHRESVHIVSETDGALDEVAIQYSSASAPLFREMYADLFRSLPPDTLKTIVCRDANEWRLFLAALPPGDTARYRPVFTGCRITPWCRDRFTLAERDGRRVLVAPVPEPVSDAERENDFRVPPALTPGAVEYPGFRFDGGDLAATRHVLFAGSGLIAKNGGDTAELRRRLAEFTDMRVILLGESALVPRHHVAMYLTPLSDSVVLLGDPELARGESVPFGAPDFSPDVLRQFANLRDQLRAAGFQVIGLPIVPFANQAMYITYNNVLIEERGGRRIVYMPVYGLDRLDHQAALVYEQLGFEVKPIRARALCPLGGSVHCVVNVLRRTEIASAPFGRLAMTLKRMV